MKYVLHTSIVKSASIVHICEDFGPVTLLLNSSLAEIKISCRISPLTWSIGPAAFVSMNCTGPATLSPNPSPLSDLMALLSDHKKLPHSFSNAFRLVREKLLLPKAGHARETLAVGDAKMAPPPPPRAIFDWNCVARISTVGVPPAKRAPTGALHNLMPRKTFTFAFDNITPFGQHVHIRPMNEYLSGQGVWFATQYKTPKSCAL